MKTQTEPLTDQTLARAIEYVNAALAAFGLPAVKGLPKVTAADAAVRERSPVAQALAPVGATLLADRVALPDAAAARKLRKAWADLTGAEETLRGGNPREVRLPRPLWHVRRAVYVGRAPQLVRKAAGRKASTTT